MKHSSDQHDPLVDFSFDDVERMLATIDQTDSSGSSKERPRVQSKVEEKPVNIILESYASTGDILLDYLNRDHIEYIERRDNHGYLWIIGGPELSTTLYGYNLQGIKYDYDPRGCKVTSYRSAWKTRQTTRDLNRRKNRQASLAKTYVQSSKPVKNTVIENDANNKSGIAKSQGSVKEIPSTSYHGQCTSSQKSERERQLESELAVLKSHCAELEKANSELTVDVLPQKSQRVSQLESELATLTAHSTELEQKNRELTEIVMPQKSQRVSQLESELATLTAHSAELETKNKELTESVLPRISSNWQKMESELAALKEQYSELEGRNGKLVETVQQQKDEGEEQAAIKDAKITDLTIQCATLESMNSKLAGTVRKQKAEGEQQAFIKDAKITGLTMRCAKLESINSELAGAIQEQKADIEKTARKKQEIALIFALQQIINQKEVQQAAVKEAEIKRLTMHCKELERMNREIKENAQQQKSEYESQLESELTALKNRCAKLEEGIKAQFERELKQKKAIYNLALEKLKSRDIARLKEAIRLLKIIEDYAGSAELMKKATQTIAHITKTMENQRRTFIEQNLCQHCGGSFKGITKKYCRICGREKDY